MENFELTMKSKLLANGLSKRTNHCLAAAGIPIEKESIIPALKAGKLFPRSGPPPMDEALTTKFVAGQALTQRLCLSFGPINGRLILRTAFHSGPTTA